MLKKDIVISLLAGGGGGYRIDIREPHTYFSFRLSRRRRECTCTYNIYTAMHTTHPGKEGVQTPSLFFFSPSLSPSPVFIMARRCRRREGPRGGEGTKLWGIQQPTKRLRRRNIHRTRSQAHGGGGGGTVVVCARSGPSLSHTHTHGHAPVSLCVPPPTVLTRLGMGRGGIKLASRTLLRPWVGRVGSRAWRRGRREALYD